MGSDEENGKPERSDPLTEQIIGAAIEVHRALGPGLLESSYEACFVFELMQRGLSVARQVELPVIYKGQRIECGYRIDVMVEGNVVVEVKAVEKIIPIHEAQLMTYLKLSGIRKGLLLNFNTQKLADSIVRRVL
jgi:GxxExxY protein